MRKPSGEILKSVAPVAVFLCVFAYLLYCAAPGLYWGDSAEMAAVSCDLGVPHSPGYPLQTQLSRVFSWTPLADYAFRINVMSATLTALSATLLYGAAVAFTGGGILAGLEVVIGLLGCREFSRYGLIAEVYPLHLLFFSSLLFLVGHKKRGDNKGLAMPAIAIVAAFGIAHHLMAVISLAALLFYMMLQKGHKWRVAAGLPLLLMGAGIAALFRSHDTAGETVKIAIGVMVFLALVFLTYIIVIAVKKKAEPGTLATAAVFLLLLGFASILYAHIPLASARGPVSDWWSPNTVENFFQLILLQGYESTFPADKFEWLRRLNLIGVLLQIPIFVLTLTIPGLIYLFRKRWDAALFLIATAALSFLGSMIVQHGKPEALRLPVYIVLYMIAGVGGWAFVTWRIFAGRGFRMVLRGLAFACVAIVLALNLPDSDWRQMRRSTAAADFGKRILDEVRPGGILFIGSQTPSIMTYFNACEPAKMRDRDISIVPVSFLAFDWGFQQLRRSAPGLMLPPRPAAWKGQQEFRLDDPTRARYAAELLKENNLRDSAYSDYKIFDAESGFKTIPRGVVYQIVPDDIDPDRLKKMMASDSTPKWDHATAQDMISAANIASVFNERGKIYLERGYDSQDDLDIEAALSEFDEALKLSDGALKSLNSALNIEKKAIEKLRKTFNMEEKSPDELPDELDPGLPALKKSKKKEKVDDAGALGIFYSLVGPLLDVKAEASSNRGQCLLFKGDYLGGLKLMESALRLSPTNPRLYETLATVYFRQQNPEAVMMAIAIWKAGLMFDPGNPRMLHNIGGALVGLKQKEQAIEYYNAALSSDPRYRSAYINLARLYNSSKNCQMAVITLEKARDIFPKDMEVRSELAQQYADCSMKHLYSKEIQGMMTDFPNDERLFYTLGIVFRNGLQIKNLSKSIREVQKLSPGFPLRKFFESMTDCRESIYVVSELVKEMPGEPDLELELSLRYGMCGDEKKAIEIMRGVVKKYPQNKGAKMILDSFEHPEKYYKDGEDTEAGAGLKEYINGGR